MAHCKALLVGNTRFPSDRATLAELKGPGNDILQMRQALIDAEVGLFDPADVRMLLDKSSNEIMYELESLFSEARRDDTILLYYSGHGLLDERSRLYLCAFNTETTRMKATSVSSADVLNIIEDSAVSTTVILLDCCHSGAFKGGDIPAALRGHGRFVLTSTRSGQLANDADSDTGASVFTKHLVDALVFAAQDSDADGFVDLNDVYAYVHRALDLGGKQTPQRSFAGDGAVAIARRPLGDVSFAIRPDSLRLVRKGAGTIPPQAIRVQGATSGWTAHSEDDWLVLETSGEFCTVRLLNPPAPCVGRIKFYDRDSGASKVATVDVLQTDETTPFPPPAPSELTPEPPRGSGPSGPEFASASPNRRPWLLAGAAALGVLLLAVLVVAALALLGGDDQAASPSATTLETATAPPTSPATTTTPPTTPVTAVTNQALFVIPRGNGVTADGSSVEGLEPCDAWENSVMPPGAWFGILDTNASTGGVLQIDVACSYDGGARVENNASRLRTASVGGSLPYQVIVSGQVVRTGNGYDALRAELAQSPAGPRAWFNISNSGQVLGVIVEG